jgi:hypothetical protein
MRSSQLLASLTGLGPARIFWASAAWARVRSRQPSSRFDSCHSGRARVHPVPVDATAGDRRVTSVVVDDIGAGVADLAWGLEDAQMVTLGEHSALAAEEPVEALGNADTEALHGAGELLGVVGFHDEVEVVALDGPVDDTHARRVAGGDESAGGGEEIG